MEIHGFDDVDLDINGGGNQLNEFLIDQFNRGITIYITIEVFIMENNSLSSKFQ